MGRGARRMAREAVPAGALGTRYLGDVKAATSPFFRRSRSFHDVKEPGVSWPCFRSAPVRGDPRFPPRPAPLAREPGSLGSSGGRGKSALARLIAATTPKDHDSRWRTIPKATRHQKKRDRKFLSKINIAMGATSGCDNKAIAKTILSH